MARPLRTSLLALGSAYLLGCCALLGGEGANAMAPIVERARTTASPDVLKACFTILVVEHKDESLKELKALLATEDRLKVLDGGNLLLPNLHAVLQSIATNVDGRAASDMFVELYKSEGFSPELYYERKGGDVGPWGEPDPVWRMLGERRREIVCAAGLVREPTAGLIELLKKELMAHNYVETAETLGRIGTREAVDVLRADLREEPGELGAILHAVTRFRDRPEVFSLLVDMYLRWEKATDAECFVEKHILATYWEPGDYARGEGIKPIPYPSYENIANKDAEAYMRQLDRLLAAQGENALKGVDREKVQKIRNLMFAKAEEYKRIQQHEGKRGVAAEKPAAEGQGRKEE